MRKAGFPAGVTGLVNAWLRLGNQTAEMLTSSAFVIHARTRQLAKPAGLLKGQDMHEATRMVAEKYVAATESCLAMSQTVMTMQTRLATSVMQAMLPSTPRSSVKTTARNAMAMTSDLMRCAEAGLKPVRKRAVANRKRLSRKRKPE